MTEPLLTLSPRLRMIASLVPTCKAAADIGADHGRLSAALLLEGTCQHMLVCDISEPSLAKARGLFASIGLTEHASFCVGDGLAAYEAEQHPEAIVIAGVGGATACGILERGRSRIGNAALIISPMLGIEDVRRYLGDNGYAIEAECIIRSANRWALALRARRSPDAVPYTRVQCLLGPHLSEEGSEGFMCWLQWRIDVLEDAERSLLHANDASRLAQVQADLALLHGRLHAE